MMRDPIEYTFMLYGNGMTVFDWTTMLALFVVAIVYFIAPVLGYSSSGRGPLVMSMWLLLAKFSLSLLKFGFLFREVFENGSATASAGKSTVNNEAILMAFFLLESGLFVVAMVLFVCGLATLRRPYPVVEPRRRDFPDE